ncbi:DNA-binding PadR family transcriptional regulator [Spinactinospora alkalitolerans]|uniref:DNA-binding PadR family transcriptional regulator n=1 Tax=Spinactinospora alkalitolerans TaxID=687207 RepID=A0A852TY53_9ACTN|nr:helix-turn-helix transcriptional regulator [Spinactinospora alkalitolerans]NYE48929.1 DNA-binding PadR family transcriptional regulator [Spinactinospora alkalitolerans]
MSATRLLVLGVVRIHGRANGYQVWRELMSWGVEKWANTKTGSVYHALRQLTKKEMLSATGDGDGDGGDRAEPTVYELTEAGETEFLRLLDDALMRADAKPDLLGAGVTFMCARPRAHVVLLLGFRLRALEAERDNLRSMLKNSDPWGKPEHVQELFGLWVSEVEAAVGWTRGLIERLEAGAYTMADDPGAEFGAPGALPNGL